MGKWVQFTVNAQKVTDMVILCKKEIEYLFFPGQIKHTK